MAILITGGAGYIGSHTCIELLNNNYKIIVVDNLSNSSIESLNRVKEITGKQFKFYNESVLNREKMNEIFLENNIEAVIHFAGFKAVGESTTIPLTYYYNNIISTIILCGKCSWDSSIPEGFFTSDNPHYVNLLIINCT